MSDESPNPQPDPTLKRGLTTEVLTGLAQGVGTGVGLGGVNLVADQLLHRPAPTEEPKPEVIIPAGAKKDD